MQLSLSLPDAPPLASHRAPRHWLPEPEELADALAHATAGDPPPGFESLAQQMGAPCTDLSATFLTARATLMAADHGRAFYHHELRRRLPMPEHLAPEVSVWDGGTVPAWADGVLAEPKYFSFFQDAPFPAYNPNHRRKWRAHELLHGSSRFFWHPQMTRFEFYISARLNELVPVLHWYHLDEAFRPRCPEHLDQVLHRQHCLACQQAARPYWDFKPDDLDARRDAAVDHIAGAWAHLQREWEAIDRELSDGRRMPTPGPRLDASSDAVGYMRAHWNRVTAWSFGHWVETFLVDGVDYFSRLDALRHNVAATLHGLVGGDVDLQTERFFARRTRAQLQDLGYRLLLALEWLDPDGDDAQRAEEILMPQLQRCAQLAHELLEDTDRVGAGLDQFARTCQAFSQVAPRFPEDIADGFLAFGYRFIDRPVFGDAAIGQVFQGIEDALPATADAIDDPLETTRQFILHDHFDAPGRLSSRFAHIADDIDAEVDADLARFEAMANAEPRRDREATHFGALPDHPGDLRDQPGRLRPHHTLRRQRFHAQLLSSLTDQPLDEEGHLPVAACLIDGDLRLTIEDEATTTILDAVQDGSPIDEWLQYPLEDALMNLLHSQHLVWLPRPRR